MLYAISIQSMKPDLVAEGLSQLATAYSVDRSLAMKSIDGKDARRTERKRRLKLNAEELPNSPICSGANVEELVWKFGQLTGKTFKRNGQAGEFATNQLSAASKFLWFSGMYNVRIFDRQAYVALYGQKNAPMSLNANVRFCKRWKEGFDVAFPLIQEATTALCADVMLEWPTVSIQSPLTKEDVIAEVKSVRFSERVYAGALWLRGAKVLAELERKRKSRSGFSISET